MRNPLRTEAEAFSFVLVAAVCFLAIALAAALGGAWVTIAVFLALALGIGVGIFLRSEPRTREPAVWDRRAPDGRRRVLVVAGPEADVETLRGEVLRRTGRGDAEVLVVAPGLDARAARWSEDAERSRAEAARRLDETVAALREAGADARGTVGDADPLRAIRDAMRTFHADELLVDVELEPAAEPAPDAASAGA